MKPRRITTEAGYERLERRLVESADAVPAEPGSGVARGIPGRSCASSSRSRPTISA